MNIFEEISWPQFVKLEKVRRLPLNEQVKEYNQYIYDLSLARQSWLNDQPKGPKPLTLQVTGVLLQEDLFDLEQEDGNKILITEYA
jgi:hypothetical protein